MEREDSVIDFGECSSRTTQWVMESGDVEPDFETEVTEEYVIADEILVEEKTVRTVETMERTAIKIPKQLATASASFIKPRPIQKTVTSVVHTPGRDTDPKKMGPVKAISLAEAQRIGLVPSNGSRSPHVVVVKPGTPGPGFKVVTGQAEIRVMTGAPSAKPVHLVKLDPTNKGSAEFLSPKKVAVTGGKLPVRRSGPDDYNMPPPSPSPSVRGYGGSRPKGEVVMLTNPSYSRYAASAYAPSESGRESRMSGFSDIYSRADTLSPTPSSYGRNYEPNGLKPRKPCNCNKSQCLKLYCECFANGEFCHNCNCLNCFNNLQHEEDRQKAIKSCLDRNANAFKPKIGKVKGTNNSTERLHNKGCNCKRSGCLKNYCECFEAKIACSDKCKCLGCKNTEEALCPNSAAKEEKLSRVVKAVKTKTGEPKPPKSFGFMTQDVVEATCQCLLAQAEEAVGGGKSAEETERLILEEYGRCLVQIIDYANKVKS